MSRYLTEKEKYLIEYMYNKEHKSQREIAKILNKHYNTIYNELKRGSVKLLNSDLTERVEYCADVSIDRYQYSCTAKGRHLKVANDFEFCKFIENKIKNHHSFYSALVLARQENFNTDVCLSTLYNYFRGGIFNLDKSFLPYKQHKQKKEKVIKKFYQFDKRYIDDRIDLSQRTEFGHWEMDTVQGAQATKTCLLVLTERKTRFELIFKIDNKKCSSVWSLLENKWNVLNKCVKTLTCDNGVEFSTNYDFKNQELKKFVQTNLFYCHPYRSCERGSNENQNKLIRRFIPKGIDIAPFTDDFIKQIQDFINNLPRKLFNGLSSQQYFELFKTEYLII